VVPPELAGCRWDPLLSPAPLEARTNWFAAANSLLLTLAATLLLAAGLARALQLDFQRCAALALARAARARCGAVPLGAIG
jgi:hypothetical protein